MNRKALIILCAFLLLASFFGAMRAHADELPPSQARAYALLVKHQTVYRYHVDDGTPTPAEADLQALVSACLAGLGTDPNGEAVYTALNPAQQKACYQAKVERQQQIVGTIALFLLGGLLIGLIALVQRLRRGVALGGRYAGATR